MQKSGNTPKKRFLTLFAPLPLIKRGAKIELNRRYHCDADESAAAVSIVATRMNIQEENMQLKEKNLIKILNIKNIPLFLFSLSVFVLFQSCHKENDRRDKAIKERIEWSHSWIEPTGKNDHPRVLIIGDSHAERYYGVIKSKLADTAYCSKFTSSMSLGDPYYPRRLELLLEQYRFDIITFNNGLHGKGYTENDYEKYIPVVLHIFQKQKGTRLIWINTTAVRKKENLSELADFNKRVLLRNNLVKKYMKKNNVPLLDFYSIGINHPEFYAKDGVHFNKEGVLAEAYLLSKEIRKQLLLSKN